MSAVEWRALKRTPAATIIRDGASGDVGVGLLYAADVEPVELSAYGAIAQNVHGLTLSAPELSWTGTNLLCNAAPTPFDIDGVRAASVESFQKALKLPAGSADRSACLQASAWDARERTRHLRASTFEYAGRTVVVDSDDHAAIVAAAISAKVRQVPAVRAALLATGRARLAFPPSSARSAGVLARITPLVLMIERWQLRGENA
jgi:hypothetical protein